MFAPFLALALAAAHAPRAKPPLLVTEPFPHAYALTKSYTRGLPAHVEVTPDGTTVLYLESGPRSSKLALYAYDVASGASKELVTPAQVLGGAAEQVSVAEQARRERMRQTEQGFTTYALSRDGARVLLPLSGKVFVLDRKTGAVLEPYAGGDAAIDPHLSPDGARVAYVRSNDLFVASVQTGREARLTHGGSADLTHGLAEFNAAEELGRERGFWWSPNGKSIAYEEADSRALQHFTIADPAHPERPANVFAYPRAGTANAKVRVGVVAASGGPTRWLAWDHAAWPYVSAVLWQKGARAPVLEVRSRDQRELAYLSAADQAPYFKEHDAAWLDPTDCPRGLGVCGPVILDDGRIVRLAQTASGVALQVVRANGEATLVQPAAFGARTLLAADASNAWVLASADPTDSGVWRVPLDGGAPRKLTSKVPGEHLPFIRAGAALWVDGFTDATHLTAFTLRDAQGHARGALPSQAEAPPLLPTTQFTTVTAQGRTYQVAVTRPRAFDPRLRYPVIDAVYGGPLYNQVLRNASSLLLDQWYADQGFVVVRVDGRGTPRRSRAWEKAIEGDLATVPLADQASAIRALGSRFPELDLRRVGITGWSFGGYLSALAVLARPDVFAAAVAGAPVVDWADYDTGYTERYLGTPEGNPAAYARSSVLTYAKRLIRPLVLIHGTADDNVYFFNSLKLMDALFHNGQRAQFVPLAGQTHILSDPATRARIYGLTARTFRRELGTPEPSNSAR